jgi:hypothetical protein
MIRKTLAQAWLWFVGTTFAIVFAWEDVRLLLIIPFSAGLAASIAWALGALDD